MGNRKGIMRCYHLEEKRLEKWNPPYLVQSKLDGERCRGLTTPAPYHHNTLLLSSEENPFNHTVPHIKSAIEDLCQFVRQPMELDGELYKHGWSFEQIHSVCSSQRVTLHEDYEQMEYHIFDIIDESAPQYIRTKQLSDLKLTPPLILVPSYIAHNLEDILKIYDKLIDQGYEGIVIRHIDNLYVRKKSIFMMKFKPKKSDIYLIVGWNEEHTSDGLNTPKGRIGSIICIKDGETFSVSAGLDNDKKAELWKIKDSLAGMYCKVWYQAITADRKVPKFVFKIEIIESEPNINPLMNFAS